MPNPFSKKPKAEITDTDTDTASVPVVNSCLACQYCFKESSEGVYYPDKKTLVWKCDVCSKRNVVRDVKL